MTSHKRQDRLDSSRTAEDPARPTADRITAIGQRLAAEVTQTAAGSPLAAITTARELSALATEALHEAVDRARAAGHSWKEIGVFLDTTRQAAFQRFGHPAEPHAGEPTTRPALGGAAERATAIFADLAAGNWESARADFNKVMLERVSGQRLADSWTQMAALLGRYERSGEPVTGRRGVITTTDVPLYFEAGEGNGQVSFDSDGTVAGLVIRPAERGE